MAECFIFLYKILKIDQKKQRDLAAFLKYTETKNDGCTLWINTVMNNILKRRARFPEPF